MNNAVSLKLYTCEELINSGPIPFGPFTTMRFSAGKVLFADAHFQRLHHSLCSYYHFSQTKADACLVQIGKALENKLDSERQYRIRVSFQKDDVGPLAIHIVVKPFDPNKGPLSLTHFFFEQQLSTGQKNKIKLPFYQEREKYLKEAKDAGYDQFLRFNLKGDLRDWCYGNVFIINSAMKWSTPLLCQDVFDGIYRQKIMNFLSENHIIVHEETIGLEQIQAAQMVVLTNSLRGIVFGKMDFLKRNERLERYLLDIENKMLSREWKKL